MSEYVDIGWVGIPNWVSASTAFLTLGAAVFAGIWARKAAHSTKAQADSAAEQSRIAAQQLEVALEDVEIARAEAARQNRAAVETSRRVAEARLDERIPRVFARATPIALEVRLPGNEWDRVTGIREIVTEPVIFKMSVNIHFQNVSREVARIAIVQPDKGEVQGGIEKFILPGESEAFVWHKTISAEGLKTDEQIHEISYMRLRFWVTDVGMDVRDEYVMTAELRHFARDGSRLLVSWQSEIPWSESVAVPISPRHYDRLDAAS